MGFRLAVVLCVTFAVVARGQFVSTITNDLSSKENQLNCLLGKPNCVSPSPPPTSGAPPPATPPTSTPTTAPVPSPSEGTPAPGTPGGAPIPSPVLAPAPGPAGDGTAVAVISLSFPDDYVVTDAIRAQLVAIIQQELGPDAVVALQVSGGRKLLQISTLTIVITKIKSCADIGLRLQAFINGGRFVSIAISQGIRLQSASLNAYSCTYPAQPPFNIDGPPATAPGAIPTSAPGTAPGSAPGTTPGSGPGSAPGTSPGSGPALSPSPVPAPSP